MGCTPSKNTYAKLKETQEKEPTVKDKESGAVEEARRAPLVSTSSQTSSQTSAQVKKDTSNGENDGRPPMVVVRNSIVKITHISRVMGKFTEVELKDKDIDEGAAAKDDKVKTKQGEIIAEKVKKTSSNELMKTMKELDLLDAPGDIEKIMKNLARKAPQDALDADVGKDLRRVQSAQQLSSDEEFGKMFGFDDLAEIVSDESGANDDIFMNSGRKMKGKYRLENPSPDSNSYDWFMDI